MKLQTLRSILQFALDLEAMASAFYETAITITTTQELKATFEALLLQGQSRIQTVMQLRQQLTPELLQGSVTAIESEIYRPHTECPPGCPDAQLIDLASKMEQQIQDYFVTVGEKVDLVEEVSDTFEHLAEDHNRNHTRYYLRPHGRTPQRLARIPDEK